MKKVLGHYYTKGLGLPSKKEFSVKIAVESLYDENRDVIESNQLVREQIAKKYEVPLASIHEFFVIDEIIEL